MTFHPTTKKKLTYNFANSTSDMPPMSYAVANEQEDVRTVTMDGKEGDNTAMPNDIIMSGPSKERYVVKAAKFPKLYSGTIGGPVFPEQSPRQVALYSGKENVNFKASWGEDMILKPGDYLVKEAEGKYYRVAKHEYEITYSQPGKNESWMRGIFGESPSKKNYDGINEIFGLFGKKPAPAAAPAPQRKPPVATCPFCQSETVFSGSDDSYAPTYAPVLQCEKCNKYWAGNKVPPSGLDPKMAKDSDTKMIVGSVSESAWMRSFLTESFKPYKKSTSDW